MTTQYAFCATERRWRYIGHPCSAARGPRVTALKGSHSARTAASNAAPLARSFPSAARPKASSGGHGQTPQQPRPAGSPLRRSGTTSHTAGTGRAATPRVARPT